MESTQRKSLKILSVLFHKRTLFVIAPYVLALLVISVSISCTDNVILQESLSVAPTSGYVSSGDIFIASGGSVATTTSPFPLHTITQWSDSGAFVRTIAASPIATTLYFGVDLDVAGTKLYHSVEAVDRVETVDLTTLVTTTHVLDAGLSGATMRALAMLSDGGVVAAESTTVIEKYTSAKVRVTVNFPITVTANIMGIKRISGDRFAVLFNGNPDNPKIYNNDGTLAATVSGLACTTNCDPAGIVELADGRFVISVQAAASNSLELFSSSFAYIGQFYKDATVLQSPGPLTLLKNGDILACSTAINSCERIAVSGDVGTRVGSHAFISDSSRMRQPTAIVAVP